MTPLTASRILLRAREAQRDWAALKVSRKCKMLRRLRREIAASAEQIAGTIAAEVAKPALDALSGDVLVTLEHLRYYERHAVRILRKERVGKPWIFFRGSQFESYPEPHGVALIFGASNYPFQLSVIPLATALVAGNAVVLKCSERTPATASVIAHLCERAGLPRGLVQVLCSGPDEAAALIDARPDFIFFTGSSANGRAVAEHAARNLIPCALELGGKDAAIVFADCNLKRAIEGITYGAFSNDGRVCVAVKRVYVETGIYAGFLECFKDRLKRLNVGPDLGADLCPEPGGFSICLQQQIEDALARGAILEFPEQAEKLTAGPVVLSNVPREARILLEELFGPVVCVSSFQDEEEAVALANASEFALSSSVWTSDRKHGRKVASQLSSGSCAVNDVIRVIANPFAPFGGNRSSGYGRYHGPEGLRTFSRVKTVMISNDSAAREIHWFPFAEKITRQLASVIRLRHGGFRSFARFSILLSLIFSAFLAVAWAGRTGPETHFSVRVSLAPGAHGELAYLIFASANGFPSDRDKAVRRGFLPIANRSQMIEFSTDLPAGTYAVSVYEDLNGNHKLDRNFLGIPREPVGVSNNPPARHGAPRFEECSFRLSGANQTISITVVPTA
ncbi:MAG TPA: aldehyde dehydrogenase family protein [Acidobacteriaceae bacterium]|nr:aldehyde dehydrogenase family protein [Acidobacteriaceae bacterium]